MIEMANFAYQVEPATEPLFENLLGHDLSRLTKVAAKHIVEAAAQLPHARYNYFEAINLLGL